MRPKTGSRRRESGNPSEGRGGGNLIRGVAWRAGSFDGRGNYSLGLKEHIVFPEIDYDKVEDVLGMDIVVCTTASNDDEARALLKGLNFPFRS